MFLATTCKHNKKGVGQGPQAPAGANVLSIKPPTTGDDTLESDDESEEDEDEDRPFSRDELKLKTMRGLAKRDTKEKKGGGKKKKGPK